jgi:hypothetical protein
MPCLSCTAGEGNARRALTPQGAASLDAAQERPAPATLRAYKADWVHFSQWWRADSFAPIPEASEVAG